MQGSFQLLKYELWDRLKVIFDKYTDASGEIQTATVQKIARQVLGQNKKDEIDYIIKNMFRVDRDGNGTVSFLEFGNFLFKRHCGQISLQKLHKAGLISNGAVTKITRDQFYQLINNAYSFLGVKANADLVDQVFKEADKDSDGLITYVEYFKFIQKYVCQTKAEFAQYQKSPDKVKQPEPVPQPVDLGKQWNSKIRLYIWLQLRRLYEIFVLGRNLTPSEPNLRALIKAILGDISELQITFLLTGLLKLNIKTLQFVRFAIIFINLVAQLGLSRYQQNNNAAKKTLNAQEFVVLFRNAFKFLNIAKIKKSILLSIFALIDKNHDGIISFNQYLEWVKSFLAIQINRGDEFYLIEDDESIEGADIFQTETALSVLPDPHESQHKHNVHNAIIFNFSNWDLSNLVRKRVWDLLVPYDKNKDKKFDEGEINNALANLLKQNQNELQYVTRNVFRYDVDGDKNITYDQFTNFCVQKHFGEMAIQRLHKINSYSRGKDRVMNESEFGVTLNHALAYIGLSITPEQISLLFSQIDLDKQGWISYEVYFLFLIYYFGSLRGIIIEIPIINHTQPEVEPDQQQLNSLKDLSALERFIRLLKDQLKRIFFRYDYNKNLLFEENQIQAILHHIFGLTDSQVNYILTKFFNIASRKDKSLTFEQLIKILLQIYFIEIVLKRKYKDTGSKQWKQGKISLQQFIELILFACSFLSKKPTKQDLTQIFKSIDNNNDGYITFKEYIDFIIKYLGLEIQSKDYQQVINQAIQQSKPNDISEDEWGFIINIWNQLKAYFDHYDSGSKGYLTQQDIKRFVKQILKETTQRELDYIFWNLFRIDPNSDRKTQFHQFAPFILKHAGQIALQKFHRNQIPGTKTLTEANLFVVFSNAYSFLSTMPKSQIAVSTIYKRIGKGSDPTYAAYCSWINNALTKKLKK